MFMYEALLRRAKSQSPIRVGLIGRGNEQHVEFRTKKRVKRDTIVAAIFCSVKDLIHGTDIGKIRLMV